jgi:hypothetical protein
MQLTGHMDNNIQYDTSGLISPLLKWFKPPLTFSTYVYIGRHFLLSSEKEE